MANEVNNISRSFADNVNYIAELDKQYYKSGYIKKNGIQLGSVEHYGNVTMNVFNKTLKVHSKLNLISGSIIGNNGLSTFLNNMKIAIQALYPDVVISISITDGTNAVVDKNLNITLLSADTILGLITIDISTYIQPGVVSEYKKYSIVSSSDNFIAVLPYLSTLDDSFTNTVNTLSMMEQDIKNVNNNMTSITGIANDVIPNITSILNAPTNAAIATTKASEASASATSASTSASTATIKSTEASTSAAAALASKNAASTSETNALASKNAAATSATNASASETNALSSKNAAAISATSASGSATTATTKSSEASTSATNAATSATASANSATNSATSATASATSATNSANSATAAAASAASAAAIAGGSISLDSLNNVTAPAPLNGDILSYVTATTDWRPISVLPVSKGGTGTTTSTGTGSTVLNTSPVLVTPTIGVATGTSFNSITGLSSTTPLMDGTATAGTGVTVARADHVHPKDTTKIDANANITAGTYKSVKVDVKGLVTGGTNPTTLSEYGITDAVTKVVSTDNAIVRFDGPNGVVQDSKVVVADSGFISANASTGGEHVFKPNTTAEFVKVSAAASDYSSLPSWSSTSIGQYGSTATGNFTGSIPNASLGLVWCQNINNMIIGNNSGAPLIFATGGTEKMRLNFAGNLLVGTTTDNGVDKIQVNGSIVTNNYQSVWIPQTSWSGTSLIITPKNIGLPANGLLEFSVLLGFNTSGSYSEVHIIVVVNFSTGYPGINFNNSYTVIANTGKNETGAAPTVSISTTKSTALGLDNGTLVLTIPSTYTTQVYSCQVRKLANAISY